MERMLVLVGIFVLLSGVFGVIEWRWPSIRGQRRFRAGFKTDAAWWFTTPIMSGAAFVAVALAVAGIALAAGVPLGGGHIKAFATRDTIISAQPAWLQVAEALLWFDLVAYWSHRAFHRIEPLWRYHAIHHSSTEVDWLSSVRVHPVNEAVSRVAQAVPLVLVGYSGGAVAALIPALTLYAIILHANASWNFGWFRYIIASPVYHRWHHTTEKEGLDRNFSGTFPFVDIIFGTLYFPKDRMPMEFGVLGEHIPTNLLRQLVYPFQRKHRYIGG